MRRGSRRPPVSADQSLSYCVCVPSVYSSPAPVAAPVWATACHAGGKLFCRMDVLLGRRRRPRNLYHTQRQQPKKYQVCAACTKYSLISQTHEYNTLHLILWGHLNTFISVILVEVLHSAYMLNGLRECEPTNHGLPEYFACTRARRTPPPIALHTIMLCHIHAEALQHATIDV